MGNWGGLLTGKMTAATTFSADNHRTYNRHGEAFDVGETFAGIDFATGLAAVKELRALVRPGATMAQLASTLLGPIPTHTVETVTD